MSYIQILFSLLPLGAAGLLAVLALKMQRKGLQVQQWPTTPGVITRCEKVDVRDEDGVSQMVKVEYTYQVQMKRHTGKEVCPGGLYSSNIQAFHAPLLRLYKEGTQVMVYYEAANPENAFLETKPRNFWWLMVAAFFFGAVGVVMMVWAFE